MANKKPLRALLDELGNPVGLAEFQVGDTLDPNYLPSLSLALAALNSLTPAADRLPYFNGASTAQLAVFAAQARTFLAAADQAAQRAALVLDQVTNTSDANKPVSTAQQTALDLKASLSGAAFTGSLSVAGTLTTGFNVTVDRSSGSAAILLTSPAGTQRLVYYRTAGVDRWRAGASAVAESGSNAGSDYTIDRYSDAGVGLGTAMTINRSTGETLVPIFSCLGPLKVGKYTLTTLPSAATYSGYEIDVTNATGGVKRCVSDGTNWKILNTLTTVS